MSDKDPKGLKQTIWICQICNNGFVKKKQYYKHTQKCFKKKRKCETGWTTDGSSSKKSKQSNIKSQVTVEIAEKKPQIPTTSDIISDNGINTSTNSELNEVIAEEDLFPNSPRKISRSDQHASWLQSSSELNEVIAEEDLFPHSPKKLKDNDKNAISSNLTGSPIKGEKPKNSTQCGSGSDLTSSPIRGERPKNNTQYGSGSEIPHDTANHVPLQSNSETQQKPKIKRIVKEKAFDGRIQRKIWRLRGKKDLYLLFKEKKNHIKRTLNMFMKTYKAAMFYLIVTISMKKQSEVNRRDGDNFHFNSSARRITHPPSQFDGLYTEATERITEKFEDFICNGSDYIMERIHSIGLFTGQWLPYHGKSYIPTPPELKNKKAIVNVKNKDNLCFLYSILAHLYPNLDNRCLVHKYKPLLRTLKYNPSDMPMSIKNIPKFEKQNNMTINVYQYTQKTVLPLRISKRNQDKAINLLLLEKGKKKHFCYISKFDALLRFDKNTRVFCNLCLHGYVKRHLENEKISEEHLKNCYKFEPAKIKLPEENKNKVYFKGIAKQHKAPKCLYADFESVITPEGIHKPSGFALVVKSQYSATEKYKYTGPDSDVKFIKLIKKLGQKIHKELKDANANMKMFASDWVEFETADKCHICKGNLEDNPSNRRKNDHLNEENQQRLDKLGLKKNQLPTLKEIKKLIYNGNNVLVTHDEWKTAKEELEEYLKPFKYHKNIVVRDHDHFTGINITFDLNNINYHEGEFRGAAHQTCNLNYRKSYNIPLFFHNFSGN